MANNISDERYEELQGYFGLNDLALLRKEIGDGLIDFCMLLLRLDAEEEE